MPSPNDDRNEDEDGDVNLQSAREVVEKEGASLPALETGDNNNNNTNNNDNNNDNNIQFISPPQTSSLIDASNNIPRTILSIPIGNNTNNDNKTAELIDLTLDSPPNIKYQPSSSSSATAVNIEADYVKALYDQNPVLNHLLLWKQKLIISIMKQTPAANVLKVIQDVVNMDEDWNVNIKTDIKDIKYLKTSDASIQSKQRQTNSNKNKNRNKSKEMEIDRNPLNQLQQINEEHRLQQPSSPPPPTQDFVDDMFLNVASTEQEQGLTEQEQDDLFYKLSSLRRDRSIIGYDDDDKDNDNDLLGKQSKKRNTNLTGQQRAQRRYSVMMYYYFHHPDVLDTDLNLKEFIFEHYTLETETEESLYNEMIHHSQNYPSLKVEDWANVKLFITRFNPRTSSGHKFINEPWIYLQKQLAVEQELLFHDAGTYYAIKESLQTNTIQHKQRGRKSSTKKGKGKGRARKSSTSSTSSTKKGKGKGRGRKSSTSSRSSTIPTTPDKYVIPFEDDQSPIQHLLIASTKILDIRLKSPDSAKPNRNGEWNDDWFATCAALDRGMEATTERMQNALKEIAMFEVRYLDLLLTRIKNRTYFDVRVPELMKMTNAQKRHEYFLEIHRDGEKRLSSVSHMVDGLKDKIRCIFVAGTIRDEWKAIEKSLDDNWKRLCLFLFVFVFVYIHLFLYSGNSRL